MHLDNGAGVCVPGRKGVGMRGRNRKGAALFPAETVRWVDEPHLKAGWLLGAGAITALRTSSLDLHGCQGPPWQVLLAD